MFIRKIGQTSEQGKSVGPVFVSFLQMGRGRYLGQPSYPFHSQVQRVHSPNLPKEKCIGEVVRIVRIIIFHLSKLWKAEFSLLCDVMFLLRLQGEFWNWSFLGVKGLIRRGSGDRHALRGERLIHEVVQCRCYTVLYCSVGVILCYTAV